MTYKVRWSEEDGEWIATSGAYESLSWSDGTPVDALQGLLGVIDFTERGTENAKE